MRNERRGVIVLKRYKKMLIAEKNRIRQIRCDDPRANSFDFEISK